MSKFPCSTGLTVSPAIPCDITPPPVHEVPVPATAMLMVLGLALLIKKVKK